MVLSLRRAEGVSAGLLPTTTELARMYEVMETITLCDSRAKAEVQTRLLRGPFYPVHGLEAVCAALSVVLEQRDYLVSTYRNLGDAIAKGVPLGRVVAEMCGRSGGASRGKGGPMHIQDHGAGLMLTTGIVGAGLLIAVGVALAAQLDGDGKVTAVTFGDGATAIGAYHEAMNLASLWSLPIVFVCQNNGWAEHTALRDYAPATDLATRASAYAMTATAVDGFDAIATWQALHDAVSAARVDGEPRFVECRTYRLGGHTATTDHSYMPADELREGKRRDPAPAFRRWLVHTGVFNDGQLDVLDARAASDVDHAFSFAASSPPPGPGDVFTDLFGTGQGRVSE